MSEIFLPPVEQLINVDLFTALQESDVGQFGPDYTNLERYKQAGEYALEAQMYAQMAEDYGNKTVQEVNNILANAGDKATLVALGQPTGAMLVNTDTDQSVQERLDSVKVCSTISDLRNTEPTLLEQQINVISYYGDGIGGGFFIYDSSDHTSPDNGGSIIVTNNGKRWKRVVDGMVDVSMYGAKPGDSTFDSSSNIQAALDNHDSVSLFGKHYFIGKPLYMPSNTLFDGLGGKLTSIATTTSEFMTGSIFAPGNYHPDYWEEVPKVSVVATKGSSTLSLADGSIVEVGDIIRLSSTTGVMSAGFFVGEYLQLARVLSKNSNVITIDGPIETSLTLVAANAYQPNYLARFNKPLFCCTDSIIQNLEVDTWDYWAADSATYNTKFSNIWGTAKAVVYGNTYCKSLFEDINITFNRRVSELAFGSHDTNLVRITAVASPNGVSDSVMFSWAESGRRCGIDNFSILMNSQANPSTIMRVSGHRDVSISNGNIYVFNNTNSIISVENYGTDANGVRPASDNIVYENINIFVMGTSTVVCDVYKSTDTSVIKNSAFKNIKYFGPLPSLALFRSRGTTANLVTGFTADVSSEIGGSVVLTNSNKNTLTFTGPVTVGSLVTNAASNSITIRNDGRANARSNDYTLEAALTVSSTTANDIVRSFVYPANSLRPTDKINLSLSGGTAGTTGTKTIQVGFIGSDGLFKSVDMAAVAADQIYWNMDIEVSFIKTQATETSALITSFTSKGASASSGTVTGSRILAVIPDLSTSPFTLQVRGWKQNTADGLSVARFTNKLSSITKE